MSDEAERLRGELGAALAEERAAVEAADELRRERDEARAEVAELRALLDAMSAARAPASADELDAARMDAAVARADLAAETATRTALRTQESQISGILADAGMPVGDLVRGVASLVRERDAARAWARLWHREARRLWREVQALSGEMATTRAEALREAAGIARAHGGISAYYAIAKLAAEVEP